MSDTLDPTFVLANRLEAALWFAIAAALLVAAASGNRSARLDLAAAAITFALFGASDLVEATTGAWWRPWWLLAWKGGCVLAMLVLLARHAKRGRASRISPPSSPPAAACRSGSPSP